MGGVSVALELGVVNDRWIQMPANKRLESWCCIMRQSENLEPNGSVMPVVVKVTLSNLWPGRLYPQGSQFMPELCTVVGVKSDGGETLAGSEPIHQQRLCSIVGGTAPPEQLKVVGVAKHDAIVGRAAIRMDTPRRELEAQVGKRLSGQLQVLSGDNRVVQPG